MQYKLILMANFDLTVFRGLLLELHHLFIAMARKDATRSSPVDNYRKEIGK